MTSRLSCAIALLLITSACGRGNDSLPHAFGVEIVNGVPEAVTSGGPKYSSPVFTFREVLTLHQDEANPESIIFRGGDFLMDESGRFFVPAYGDMSVMIFDARGEYTGSFGRGGSGPGDFNWHYLTRIQEDTLYIFDAVNHRASLHRTDGTLINVISPRERSRFMFGLEPIGESGLLVLSGVEERRGDEFWEAQRADLVSDAGDTLSSVVSPLIYRAASLRFELQGRTVGGIRHRYFKGESKVQFVPPRGLLVTTGVQPEIRWYDLDGESTRIVRLNIPPDPVTEADIARIHARLDSTLKEAEGMQRQIQAEYRKNLDIPAEKAFWSNVLIDDAGFIWLQRPLPEQTWFEVEYRDWRVLSPEGEYLGDTRTPTAGGRFSQGHYLTYRMNDDTGEREAVVFRIEPAVRGLRYPER
jgi:hypothetical protein